MTFVLFTANTSTMQTVPFFSAGVSAGFPSPADDYIEMGIDLNKLLIRHPAATFIVQASGSSMIDVGIYSGDLLIVDRSLEATANAIVVAHTNNEFLVKRLVKQGQLFYLMAENKNHLYAPIQVTEEVVIWGVVSAVVRSLEKNQ